MKKLAIVSALTAAGMFTIASAHYEGYAVDANDRLVRDSFGNCVKTGTWTKEKAIPECDPKLVRKIDERPKTTGTIPTPAVVDQPTKVEVAPVPSAPTTVPVPVQAATAEEPMVFPITVQDPVVVDKEDTTLVAADVEQAPEDVEPLVDVDDDVAPLS